MITPSFLIMVMQLLFFKHTDNWYAYSAKKLPVTVSECQGKWAKLTNTTVCKKCLHNNLHTLAQLSVTDIQGGDADISGTCLTLHPGRRRERKIFKDFQKIFKDFQRFSKIFKDFQRFLKIFKDFQRFSKILHDFQNCFSIFKLKNKIHGLFFVIWITFRRV